MKKPSIKFKKRLEQADKLFHQGSYDEAWREYVALYEIDPNHRALNAQIGGFYMLRSLPGPAIAHLRLALTENADDKVAAGIWSNLGLAYLQRGLFKQSREALEKAVKIDRNSFDYASNLLYGLNFDPTLTSRQIADLHFRLAPPAAPMKHPIRQPGERLKVGYISGDLYRHSVSYFLLPLLRHHDRRHFEIICYNNRPASQQDETTQQLRSASDQWHDVFNLSDSKLAKLIASAELDILVDLSGHTARNRLPVLAKQPARCQATWLGYPNTTGMETVQFRVVDNVTDPTGDESHYSESLLHMDAPFICFDLSLLPENVPRNYTGSTPFTFGSFNTWAKATNTRVLSTWYKILKRVPESRLILKAATLVGDDVQSDVRNFFEKRGIDSNRIEMYGWLDRESHLALYQRVDLALDTFPYCGTTTTCEALAMGVPVLSLAGNNHASRVGVSLLTALGRPDLVATSLEGYIKQAVSLASEPQLLRENRSQLANQFATSEICNGESFARRFEACLKIMHSKALT